MRLHTRHYATRAVLARPRSFSFSFFPFTPSFSFQRDANRARGNSRHADRSARGSAFRRINCALESYELHINTPLYAALCAAFYVLPIVYRISAASEADLRA